MGIKQVTILTFLAPKKSSFDIGHLLVVNMTLVAQIPKQKTIVEVQHSPNMGINANIVIWRWILCIGPS